MMKYYQPLDLTVNRHAKRFFKSKISTWYADQISKQLNEGVTIDEVDVKFRLTTQTVPSMSDKSDIHHQMMMMMMMMDFERSAFDAFVEIEDDEEAEIDQ